MTAACNHGSLEHYAVMLKIACSLVVVGSMVGPVGPRQFWPPIVSIRVPGFGCFKILLQ